MKGRTVGLLGIAFKPGTDDVRDAPSLTIAESLLRMGARVKVYDPAAGDACWRALPDLDLVYSVSRRDLATGCDALLLVTEWEEFTRLDFAELAHVMNGDLVLDGRNALDADALRRVGLQVLGIGIG